MWAVGPVRANPLSTHLRMGPSSIVRSAELKVSVIVDVQMCRAGGSSAAMCRTTSVPE